MTAFDRLELIDKLETIEPALATHDSVPQLTHYWLTGKVLMAYNDQIAMSLPLKTDFQGAVPGSTLLGLLKSSTRKRVELTPDDAALLIKAGPRSTFRLAMLPPKAFIFAMPKASGEPFAKGLGEFLAAMGSCARSLGADYSSIPEQLGVTVLGGGDRLKLYTTNSSTISSATVKQKWKSGQRVILSALFCKQMIGLCKKAKSVALLVAEDHVLLQADDVTLFGRLIECERPYDFDKVIDHHFPKADHKRLMPLPRGLKGALDRAVIIAEARGDQAMTKVQVADDYMKLFSRSARGEVSDRLKLEGPHDEVSISVNPKLLLAGLDEFDQLVITDRCVVMTGDGGALYMVSASNQYADKETSTDD